MRWAPLPFQQRPPAPEPEPEPEPELFPLPRSRNPDLTHWALLDFPADAPGRVRIRVCAAALLQPLISFTTDHSSRMCTVLDRRLAAHVPSLMMLTGFHLRALAPPLPGTVLAAEVGLRPAPPRRPIASHSPSHSPVSPRSGPWH
jgi:hypothetical protein